MGAAPLETLFTEDTIRQRVSSLARDISRDYAHADELILIGVLKGAFIFAADLTRRLTIPRRVDFVALASYGDSDKSSGVVRVIMDLRCNIAGKHVLVVDDIVDTGATMHYLMKTLLARQPASLRSCVLLRKNKQRAVSMPVDYVGFEIDDVWVVGYGLEYADQFRTLPDICVLRKRAE